jgi:NitT/TauT family transport system substrate-binding protein
MMKLKLSENFRAVFYAPFFATIALGYCADEGLDIEFFTSATPEGAAAGLIDGSLDVSWGGPMRVMRARNSGSNDLVCVCDVVRKDPFYLVGRAPQGGFTLGNLPQMRLGSVSEVPTPWLCLQHDLRLAGIDPASIERIADKTMGENVEALRRGDLDVVQMFEPFASMAVRTGAGTILHAASGRGPTAYTTFLATRRSVERNRDALAALTRAVARTQAWLVGRTPGEIADTVASYFTHVERTDLETAFAGYIKAGIWATDTVVSKAGFERLADSLLSGGYITRRPVYDDCVVDLLAG